nr:unnamed protein product [Digitaria exilis]
MSYAGDGGSLEIVPHSSDLEQDLPLGNSLRQDSLFRDANRPAHADHHGQESWARTLRLAFQCVGIMYADLGTSPLYVYSNTFKKGVGHPDDLLGVLSIIIYSFILFTMIKIVFIALHANDEGDGGTFALYSLISRYAKICLIPNQQAEDELVLRHKHQPRLSATRRRAQWMKNLLETSKAAKITLFFLTIFATALAISDCMLNPPISDAEVWITVGILVVFFSVQRFGTDKIGYTFAPVVTLWLLLISGIGIYNVIKYDTGTLRAFDPKHIIGYFRRNKKKGWVSLGEILLCVTGTEALFADLGYFSIRSIQLSSTFILLPSVLLTYIGQAAYLRNNMDNISNAFFSSVPKRFLFRQVEPKELMVFRCVARYGYRDTLEMANGFVEVLVEYLQYYVRDLSLYELGEPLRLSDYSARIDSFSTEKPSGHAIYAEEMITPIQSFSELTMHPVGMSNILTHFQTGKMNVEEMLKIEEDQKIIQREVNNGVIYILGETEVVAKPHSNLLKKIIVNYVYSFLRKNSRNGEKMLSIPRGQLLKVGITYEI